MGTQRTREDSESGTGGAGDRMKTEELTKIEGEDTGLNTQEWFTKDTQVLKKTKTGSGESQLDRWGCNCKIKQDLNKPITQTVTLAFVRLTSCQTIGQNLTVVSAAWKSIGDLRSWLFQTKKEKLVITSAWFSWLNISCAPGPNLALLTCPLLNTSQPRFARRQLRSPHYLYNKSSSTRSTTVCVALLGPNSHWL